MLTASFWPTLFVLNPESRVANLDRSEEDELRAQKLEAEVLEGRRRRQALKSRGASPSKDMGSLNVSKQRSVLDSGDKSSEFTRERVISTKEQEIRDTIEQLVGKSGTLSVDVNKVTRNFSSSNSDGKQENVGKSIPPAVSAKPRHLSGSYGSPGMFGASGTRQSLSQPKSDLPSLTTEKPTPTKTPSSSPFSSIAKTTPRGEGMLSAGNNSPGSQSPARLSRSPTRGGFIQSALLKRQEATGNNAHGSPPTTPSWKKSAQPAMNTPGSLFSSPVLLSKPDLSATSPAATSSHSKSESGSAVGAGKDETENERVGRANDPTTLRREESRLTSPERKKTWLESALNRNPSDTRSRSPSPVKSFAERPRPKSVLLPGSGGIYSPATPLVSIQRQDSSASKSGQSKDELIYANIAKPSSRDSLAKTPGALSAQTTGGGYIPEAKSWKTSADSPKRWSSITENEESFRSEPNWKGSLRHTTSNSMLREEPRFSNDLGSTITNRGSLTKNSMKSRDDLKTEAFESQTPNWKTSLKKTTSRDNVKTPTATLQPETPDWKSNLKRSTTSESRSPRTTLVSPMDPFPDLNKPVDKLEENNQDLPPALQKLAALKKPPPKPLSSKPTPEALERLKGLRSSSPSKSPVRDEAKEELLKAAGSLKRSSTVKYQPPDELKDAVLATKGTLRRSPTREPKTNTPRYASSLTSDHIPEEPVTAPAPNATSFQSNLESMLMRGRPGKPQHSPSSPSLHDHAQQEASSFGLRKAHTFDTASGNQDTTNKDLKHVTKGRARGPKRRLPTKAQGESNQSSAQSVKSVLPVRASTFPLSSPSAPPALVESNSLNVQKSRGENASGQKLPPPKPRKPSSSVRAFV